ncbi:MAG TPA: LURP-one-related family protein [Firmicutes bacterium]|nr:LURP-one-related family protein [Bacillota bacterium]
MKLLFKQRLFSWFDSYDIYNEQEETVFTVKGKLSWGHCLEICNSRGDHVGTVKEEVLSFLPRFALYIGGDYIGQIKKEFTFFKPVFTLDCKNWQINGDLFEWDYMVTDSMGQIIMQASKEIFRWTDTYTIDIAKPENTLLSLMIVLAIDAAKCSSGNG